MVVGDLFADSSFIKIETISGLKGIDVLDLIFSVTL